MKSKSKYLMTALMIAGMAVGCSSTKEEKSATSEKAENLTSEAHAARAEFLRQDPSLTTRLADASGYAIFPTVGKGAVGVGGAAGKGQLFEPGKTSPLGETELMQVTVGFQAGGQAYSELIVFENQESLNSFKNGNFEFSAQATAVAVKTGASANARYEKGVMVFTIAKGGLMYEASVGGQKFSYVPYLTPTGY
jgi:lipid-binding SYLF domain-containing protein